jgi:hypothetical protein
VLGTNRDRVPGLCTWKEYAAFVERECRLSPAHYTPQSQAYVTWYINLLVDAHSDEVVLRWADEHGNADIAADQKLWRFPGSNQADFFNYKFDEFTFTLYQLKQKEKREEVEQLAKTRASFGGDMSQTMSLPMSQPMAPNAGPSMEELMGGMVPLEDMNAERMQQYYEQLIAQQQQPPQMGGFGGPYGGAGGNFGGAGRGRGRRW